MNFFNFRCAFSAVFVTLFIAQQPVLGQGRPDQIDQSKQPEKVGDEAASKSNYRGYIDLTSCAKPIWPKYALRNGEQGTVGLAFLISAENVLLDAKVIRKTGFWELDRAALVGLSACKFHADIINGRPVETLLMITYVWTIKQTSDEMDYLLPE